MLFTHTKFSFITVACIVICMTTSCVTSRQIDYLQDMTEESQIELENKFEAVVSNYDELFINVYSHQNPELAKPFNMNQEYSGYNTGGNNQNYRTYLVDVNGNIQIPVLGDLHVVGLTRLKIQDTIAALLKQESYLTDPLVQVRFANYKIFFLGPNSSKTITINNERCTFLEALALSGGLDNYARRSRIAVVREVNGKMTMHYMDPRSTEIFNDPYFMLQQNDIIFTEYRKGKMFKDNLTNGMSFIATLASLVTMATTFILYRNLEK